MEWLHGDTPPFKYPPLVESSIGVFCPYLIAEGRKRDHRDQDLAIIVIYIALIRTQFTQTGECPHSGRREIRNIEYLDLSFAPRDNFGYMGRQSLVVGLNEREQYQ